MAILDEDRFSTESCDGSALQSIFRETHFLSALTWSHLVTPQVRAVTSYAGVGQDRISVAVAFAVLKKMHIDTNAHS